MQEQMFFNKSKQNRNTIYRNKIFRTQSNDLQKIENKRLKERD